VTTTLSNVDRSIASASPVAALFADAESYRGRVRETVSGWGDAPERWERERSLPSELFTQLGTEGLFRERWSSGVGPGLTRGLVLVEEVARVSSGAALGVMTHVEVFLGALVRLSRTVAQLELLEQGLSGEVVGCFAVTEDHGGSDIAAVRTTATPAGDGWRLQGAKRFVSNAGTATHALVLGRSVDLRPGRDLSLFAVPLDARVTTTAVHDKVGLNACAMADISFDVMLGPEALLGVPGAALLYLNRLLELERVSIAWQLLVASRSALGLAAAFARQRMVGAGPLIDKQAVRHRLADAQAALWPLEAMFAHVTAILVAGGSAPRESAGLKLASALGAGRILDDCLQVFGGRGALASYPLERWWRDARVARIGGGTDDVMREIVGSSFTRPDAGYDRWLASFEPQ
jgi:alkylation response protein AidB-like acyl-CoA dehydrogenase